MIFSYCDRGTAIELKFFDWILYMLKFHNQVGIWIRRDHNLCKRNCLFQDKWKEKSKRTSLIKFLIFDGNFQTKLLTSNVTIDE